jgi:hypothetical protein
VCFRQTAKRREERNARVVVAVAFDVLTGNPPAVGPVSHRAGFDVGRSLTGRATLTGVQAMKKEKRYKRDVY